MATRNNVQIRKLKEENDDLKSKLSQLYDELKEVRKKLETSISNDEIQDSVNFMNAEYEDFNAKKSVLDNDVRKIEEKLTAFALKVNEIGETVETLMAYSYQYNLRILGIPQANAKESAQESVDLCLRLFKELKANVKEYDIDIAHRLQSRDSTRPAAIVCKFTRRVAKEAVMSKRRELRNVNLKNVVSCTEALDNPKLVIYDHLTPQETRAP